MSWFSSKVLAPIERAIGNPVISAIDQTIVKPLEVATLAIPSVLFPGQVTHALGWNESTAQIAHVVGGTELVVGTIIVGAGIAGAGPAAPLLGGHLGAAVATSATGATAGLAKDTAKAAEEAGINKLLGRGAAVYSPPVDNVGPSAQSKGILQSVWEFFAAIFSALLGTH